MTSKIISRTEIHGLLRAEGRQIINTESPGTCQLSRMTGDTGEGPFRYSPTPRVQPVISLGIGHRRDGIDRPLFFWFPSVLGTDIPVGFQEGIERGQVQIRGGQKSSRTFPSR